VKSRGRITWGYAAVLLAVFVFSVLLSWLPLASAIDGDAYDWLFRLHPEDKAGESAVVLAIDEQTLNQTGDMRHIRRTLADTLNRIAPAKPAAVAIDVILAGEADTAEDQALESALSATPNVVLGAEILPGANAWEEPTPRFANHAASVGHLHAEPDPVSRVLPLEKAVGHVRHWAMALEAFRLVKGAQIVESPDDIEVAGLLIPGKHVEGRPLYVRYRDLPVIPVRSLQNEPKLLERLKGKAVFIGVTALSGARDRLTTPMGETISGVEIHANAFATLADGRFLTPVSTGVVLLTSLLLVAGAGAAFAFLTGWPAYLAAAGVIVISHAVPHLAFRSGYVFAYASPVAAAWFASGVAAAWQYFVVRRQLHKSESDKARYQQAIHFVTHEMRSPLTAIQGSSEMMGRYNLNDEKRKQMAAMINSESKRLARMIQTFLDIERLTEGDAEIRSEPFEFPALVESCVMRARVLGERKQIAIEVGHVEALTLKGDRELMEYALYNLLTNAVKYSPAATKVTVEAMHDATSVRLAVRDQGIGMDAQELKNIFKKFYRTRRAETSGEVGTGIGLSLVEQIVAHHGGKMEVTSTPGEGSCFTMVLPRGIIASVPAPTVS
jgi:signal transduction histidine kinase